ncbi:hypothetical protein [Gandjariella thermophila]|uniref:Uncharacterized protein n=1 Tax=Gandjariella thermophila TaxID=1931992 RepID=A0A4D4J2C8_9PSEU|nr:hypothetical protein [Gandjariella thermophila]GDY28769.1 hypothetical protein GTS_04020 [Gandjariella thermophila]
MSYQADRVTENIDKAMKQLREAMKGIPIRWAGFKKEHDNAARSMANLTVLITDARSSFKR